MCICIFLRTYVYLVLCVHFHLNSTHDLFFGICDALTVEATASKDQLN
jgi:hypothetical protein